MNPSIKLVVTAMAILGTPMLAVQGESETTVEIETSAECWVTIPYAEVVANNAGEKDGGLNPGFSAFQFWATPFDPRLGSILKDVEFSNKGGRPLLRLRFTRRIPTLRVATLPSGAQFNAALMEMKKLVSEIAEAAAPNTGEGREVLKKTLDRSLIAALTELDQEVVESWHRKYPIPEPEELPLDGTPAGGVEFFRGHHSAPLVADFYLALTNPAFAEKRVQLRVEHLTRIRELLKRRAQGESIAGDSESTARDFLALITNAVDKERSQVSTAVSMLDKRLVLARDLIRADRRQLAMGDTATVTNENTGTLRTSGREGRLSLPRGKMAQVEFDSTAAATVTLGGFESNYLKPDGRGSTIQRAQPTNTKTPP